MPNTRDAKWIAERMNESIHNLGGLVSAEKINELARLITTSMSNERRSFHRPSHLFDLVDPKDSILTIAALFHDVVYYQVDQGLPAPTEAMLRPLLLIEQDSVTLRKNTLSVLPGLSIVCDLFEVTPGDRLNPVKNLNEFLSAVVAYVSLAPVLPDSFIAQVVVCIEATIPFRPQRKDNDHILELAKRLSASNQKYDLDISAGEIQSAIERAAKLANLDVKNFASEDPAWFLATTWQLMPERNENLRGTHYTFKDYRSSLEKMSDFFGFLNEELIFKRYKNYPSSDIHETNALRASRNLQIARTYITAKLVAINLVETLAVLSGGDLPISDFLGPLPKIETLRTRMEQFLPAIEAPGDTNPVVLNLLEKGLPLESSFDLKNSPLAAYVYKALGETEMISLANKIGRPAPGADSDPTCLIFFPKQVIAEVAIACAKVCFDRSEALLKLGSNGSKSQLPQSSY